MANEPEHDSAGASAETPDEPHIRDVSDRRGGWYIIGGFFLLLILLVAVQIVLQTN